MAKKNKKIVVMKKKGQPTVKFHKGGLHESTHTPQGQPIPASKMEAALAGRYGPLAKKQANMAKGMLAKGRKTANRNKRKK